MNIFDLILILFANSILIINDVIDVWKLATKCTALVCAIYLKIWLYLEADKRNQGFLPPLLY